MFTLEEVVRTLWLVDLVHQNSSSSFPPHQQFFSFEGGGKGIILERILEGRIGGYHVAGRTDITRSDRARRHLKTRSPTVIRDQQGAGRSQKNFFFSLLFIEIVDTI